MKIYKSELHLKDQILSDQSIAYCVPVQIMTEEMKQDRINSVITNVLQGEALSSEDKNNLLSINQENLHPIYSILCSSSWNNNDDVFGPEEMWEARQSPIHQKANLEHDEDKVVGHIVDCWAMDNDYKVIPDSTCVDELPNYYHLATGAVVYTKWRNPELAAQAQKLIEDINKGNMFVSMECILRGFDYAVRKDGENTFQVLARNQDTAFLTKILRRYGGDGTYNGYSIGRYLRNIKYIAFGFVSNPANKASIIFDPTKVIQNDTKSVANNGFLTHVEKSGVSNLQNDSVQNNNEEYIMADTNKYLEDQVQELKATIDSLSKENKELRDSHSKANVEALQTENTSLKDKNDALAKENDELKTQVADMTKSVSEGQTKIEELTKANVELQKTVDEVEKARVFVDRVSKLVEAGFDKDKAEAKVQKFENLSDEQFDILAAELIESHTEKNKQASETTQASQEDETKDEETLDSAEANEDEANMAAEGEDIDEAVATLRKDLVNFVRTQVMNQVVGE